MKGFKQYYSNTPVSDDIANRIISIPMFPQLADEEITFVVDSLNDFSKSN